MSQSTFQAVVFESIHDTEPRPVPFELPGDVQAWEERPEKGGALFSPAVYRPSAPRGNAGVEAVTALVLDVDHATEAQFSSVLDRLRLLGLEHAWYNTYSHGTAEKPFAARLIVPFAEPVAAESDRSWRATWAQAVREIGAEGLVDRSRSDRGGIYFLPIKPPGAAGEKSSSGYHAGEGRYTPGCVAEPPARPTKPETATVADLRASLSRCPSKEAKRAGRGEAPSPPPGKRGPDEIPRKQAWFAVTGALSRIAPRGTPIEVLEEVLRPAWYEEKAASPDDYTEWERIRENLERNYANASAEREAQEQARQKLLARMAARSAGAARAAAAETPAAEKIEICVDEGVPEDQITDAIVEVLADSPCVYTRGSELVLARGTVQPANRHALIDEISRRCRLVRTPKPGEASKPAKCSERTAAIILSLGEWPAVRELVEVRHASYLAASGAVVSKPGYDAETKCLLRPTTKHEPIPEAPTREQASAGLRELEGLVADFPFESPAHQAGWLALVLTLVARPALRQVPMWMIDAAASGSGKTLLADLAAVIAIGAGAARSAWSAYPDEQRKAVLAVLRQAAALCLIDNLPNGGNLGSHVLDNLLSSETYSDRVLGQSATLTLPARTVWCATGNNLAIDGDMQRRVVPVRLASPEDDPSARTGFRLPRIMETAYERRGELLRGALAALRGYCAAGRPPLPSGWRPWGHPFDGWSDLVRGTLAWLGASDPAEARQTVMATAESGGGTLAEVLSLLGGTPEWRATKDLLVGALGRQLQAVLADRAGEELSAKAVGKRLASLRQRVVGGRRLVSSVDRHSATTRWRVEDVKGDAQ